MLMKLIGVFGLSCLCRCAHGAEHHGHSSFTVPEWEPRVGHYAFNVTTRSSEAQKLFRVGLMLLYNFNQEAASSAFQAALEADPTCAMCAWGLACSYGPFLNRPTKPSDELSLGLAAARKASALLGLGVHTKKEHVFIESMAIRYPEAGHEDDQVEFYKRYAKLFRTLRIQSPELSADPDLMVFDAEAVMIPMCDASGYHLYEFHGDESPPSALPGTREATALLKEAVRITNGSHVAAKHLIIHSTEQSRPEAEMVLEFARTLADEMIGLDNQHLEHMSSHTFLRTGHYHEALTVNKAAVRSDSVYLHHGAIPYGPGHDSAFAFTAALFSGERTEAYKYAKRNQQVYTDAPEKQDSPDGSLAWSNPMLAAIRFGDWHLVHELDRIPPGNFSRQWSFGYGVLRRFALVVAAVHLGQLTEATTHLAELGVLVSGIAAVTSQSAFMNLSLIANHTAFAILAHATGELQMSVEALRKAVDLEMDMKYEEPPAWVLPSRECYGLALMQSDRPQEAENIFRSALYGYSLNAEPHCGWALFGLRASLQQQGHTELRAKEIQDLSDEIAAVWKHADVPLTSPCLHLGDSPLVRPQFV